MLFELLTGACRTPFRFRDVKLGNEARIRTSWQANTDGKCTIQGKSYAATMIHLSGMFC